MITTAASFIATIMTLHIYWHSFLQREQFFQNMPWIFSGWLVLYLGSPFMVIYYSSSLTNKVNIRWVDISNHLDRIGIEVMHQFSATILIRRGKKHSE